MSSKKLEVVRGSGNVFGDLNHENPDTERKLTVRAAHRLTGIAAADFSRIRNAELGRFTVDRLMSIVNRLGFRVEVKVSGRRGVQRSEPVANRIALE